MRLHHLTITAFGPFAGTVGVDFDELSEAGLFLLSGPTGAGKTSVLDAVCFALYGDVPGDRSTAKRLRSDHAPRGVRPEVVLEATLGGRRFRIRRSPSWERPKKRGSGTTVEQASVVLQEQVRGEWTTQSTRLDETGHLVSDLLGMTLTQFTQVAMLPQGRFQAFLRAGADERKALLQKLFRTQRFADVEAWLRERRVELRRRSSTHHDQVAAVLSRVSEAAGEPLPQEWDLHDLTLPAGDGSLERWVDELVAAARSAQEEATGRAAVATGAEQAARRELDEARALLERRQRVGAAASEHADLVAAAEDHALASAAVEAAGRAAAVLPVHQLVLRREQAYQAALSAARDAGDLRSSTAVEAGAASPEPLLDEARAEQRTCGERLAHARALLPRQRSLADAMTALADLEREQASLDHRIREAEERQAVLPERIRSLRERVEAARAAEPAAAEIRTRLEAHALVARLTAERTEAAALHQEAKEAALRLREEALDVRAARLDSMAAELAGALAAGACCPVCGSAEHPHKAVRAAGAPDAEAEKAAQKAADDAAAEEHAWQGRLRDLDTRLDLAQRLAGEDSDATALQQELAGLAARADALPRLEHELAAAEAERDRLGELLADLVGRRGDVTGQLTRLTASRDELRAELVAALDDLDDDGAELPDVESLVRRWERAERSARARVERLEALRHASTARDEACTSRAAACREAGFASVEEALEAALEPDVLDELTASVKHHDRRLHAVTEVLAEPGARDLLDREPPDVDALAARHREVLDSLTEAQGAVTRWVDVLARLTRHQVDLAERLAAWGPVREELEVTSRLAQFAEGKGGDNALQMSLSAYVVAYRLTQVVAAANERLTVMSDGRYSLEHTAEKGAGDRRGGLALVVRDDWSGESRDPATLSGGETFVVSLALALGLADVITQEAGGAVLDTLFVDEGFGSLDADTLDDVMDVLDSLRDGGRVVGVVSHVAEMRDRIPTQLRVTKTRHGSDLALARG